MNRTNYTSSYDGFKPDSEKSPELLQHEVDEARERLGARLDTLSHRLSPGELLDQALSMAKEHGGEFSHNLGSQVKQNPLPMLLTSVGLSWLMMGTRSPQPYEHYEQGYGAGSRPSMGDKASHAADVAKGAMTGAANRARDLKERAGEMGHSLHERAGGMSQSLHDRAESARWRARSAQQQFDAFCRDQPVLAGSLGIALGALLGSMLPHSRREDELFGSVSEEAKSRAREVGAEQYDRAREKGRELAESAKEQVHRAVGDGSAGESSRLSQASGSQAGDSRSSTTGMAGSGLSGSSSQTAGNQAGSPGGTSAGNTSDYAARGSGSPSEPRKDEGGSHPSRF